MNKLTVGILAHVDAGKTTLSEAMLYTCGALKKLGRVDNRDSFLDTDTQERKRGITIFSKQARCIYKDTEITFIDTPGHVDFSGEAERSLRILDCAILVISATDGAQAHTKTILSLLKQYNIPTFIFVTKMDVAKLSKDELMAGLSDKIGSSCLDFTAGIDYEAAALSDENMLEKYISAGTLSDTDITSLIYKRKIFPCIFGSGLKLENIDLLLEILTKYSPVKTYPEEFCARVYKIGRDNQGKRLTFVKITGGSLFVRDLIGEEKISQIRLYSGQKFESADKVCSGDVCALLGLNKTYAGQCLGHEKGEILPLLNPVLTYTVVLPKGVDAIAVYPYFLELMEEDPLLNVLWNEKFHEIEIQLMGKVQTEILKGIIEERFNLDVSFSSGRILYKETIESSVEGIGHYEPLKHYAEVHLLMEPLLRNSGLEFSSEVPTDDLDLNWQRLILTHLQEKQHSGVLTGSPITDMKITLIAGKAHLKHTEGGDFRQATYRAVRQGLMCAKSILLEPMYDFTLEVPSDCVGRAISDIHLMSGTNNPPEIKGEEAVIEGRCPASKIADYSSDVLSYTSGQGSLSLRFSGYSECHNADEVTGSLDYDPLSDIENTPDSVFCSHGAGVNISWKDVPAYCHIPPLKGNPSNDISLPVKTAGGRVGQDIDESELEAIMMREFGQIRRKSYSSPTVIEAPQKVSPVKATRIIVDGYNVIHSWDELKELAKDNLDLAREKLINDLINYHAYTGNEIVLVFDAYLVDGGAEKKSDRDGLHIVYTAPGVSADNYIERLVDEIGKNENVKVVSSDAMIQLTAVKTGVLRVSSGEFKHYVNQSLDEMRQKLKLYD